jgi:hypothetical protein
MKTTICRAALLCASVLAGHAPAAVPPSLSYQGYLTEPSGQALDEDVTVLFSLYTVPEGGVAIWRETQAVSVIRGLFSVALGADPANLFPPGAFDTPLYLGVKVGDDLEMTPRRALTSVGFAFKAEDAATLAGATADELDESDEVAALETGLDAANVSIAVVESDVQDIDLDVTQLETGLAAANLSIVAVEDSVQALDADIVQLESGLASANLEITTKQDLVSGSCLAGQAIRIVSPTGSVVCETDDTGPWQLSGATAYYTGGPVAVGVSSSDSALAVSSLPGANAFRAMVGPSTALLVGSNSGVSVGGTSVTPPSGGLWVNGGVNLGSLTAYGRLTSPPYGDLNQGGAIDLTKAGLVVGSASANLAFDADQIESTGATLRLNAISTRNVSLGAGGGSVGVGTTSPVTRLHATGGTDVTATGGGYLTLGDTTGLNVAFDNNEIMARNNGVVAPLYLQLTSGGKVSVNTPEVDTTHTLNVTGDAKFYLGADSDLVFEEWTGDPTVRPTSGETGRLGRSSLEFYETRSYLFYAFSPANYVSYSDRALKEDVAPIEGALEAVQRLEGVQYALKRREGAEPARTSANDEEYFRTHQLGFVAQDVEQVLPQLVRVDGETGYRTVGYLGFIPVLVEAIKAQQRIIDEQQRAIERLERAVAALGSRADPR